MPGDGGPPSNLRHDLLNHLHAAIGFAGILVEDLPDGDNRHYARRVLEAVTLAQNLAQTLPKPVRAARPVLLLVVTDPLAERLTAGLEGAGWEVVRAHTVPDARQALSAAPSAWSAIAVDPALPGRSGLLTAAEGAGVPAVQLTTAMAAADVLALLPPVG